MKKFALLAVLGLCFSLSAFAQTAPPCPSSKTCSGSVQFTVTFPNPSAPAAVTPASVVAGAPATTITLTAASGTTFNNQMTVEVCQLTPTPCVSQVDLTTTFVSTTSLTAQIPTNLLASSGTLQIYISQPNNAHNVALTWSDSDSTVVGYNVYRSKTSGTGYVLVNAGLVKSTSYTDTSVTAGVTYYYVTTAVDGSGTESAYSNEAQAIVP